MDRYDGPTFYRKFTRDGALNRIKKHASEGRQQEDHLHGKYRSKFISTTESIRFKPFHPSGDHYHVDLSNNPLAKLTANFKPRHYYSASADKITRPFNYQTSSESLKDQYRRLADELRVKDQDVILLSTRQTGSEPSDSVSLGLLNSRSLRRSSAASFAGKIAQRRRQVAFRSDRAAKLRDHQVSLAQRASRLSSQITGLRSSLNESKVSSASRSASSAPNQPLGSNLASILKAGSFDTNHLALFAKSSSSSNNNQFTKLSSERDEVRSAASYNPTNLRKSPRSENSAPVHHEVNQRTNSNYQFPGDDLLNIPKRSDDQGLDKWIQDKAAVLDKTLRAFNVDAQVVAWTNGPTVTQFQVKLQLGVKVNKITHLADDLKMALAARDIRIEAPIPGRTTCGIEIPNPKPRPVTLSEIIGSPVFKRSQSPLTVSLGVDLSGKPRVADIRKMPHGLIAGATGSGKSVFINSILISLLYKATPDQLRLILIDPKAVELAPYNRLPHLLSPVISEPKQAAAALKWTVKEMDQRYDKLAAARVRNIEQFNHKVSAHHEPQRKMPYIVIVIDELADLMMVASDAVETYIVRITQKARAAGIHLIVATQRPSVDIVTGTIKNNIPTRVAFMVSSQVDSRTIINTSGAERLLGRGDMLYLGSGSSQPVRLQGAFVSNQEIDRVTKFIRQQEPAQYAFHPESLLKKVSQLENEDKLMPQVLAYIARQKQISTSKLQRVFSIGYNRSASIIDDLEKHNYISGQQGSKPRDVYLTEKEYKQLNR